MSRIVLFIGNKNYSSWSLRPWLALKWGGIAFEERLIPLGGEGYGKSQIPDVLAISPSGRVPALSIDGVAVWDSLAICEWAGEHARDLWPADPIARAVARSAACEMHSSFQALRRDLSMNIRRRVRAPGWPEDTAADLKRIEELWADLRSRFGAGGQFLFGARSIADAMYAPVATRLRTYGVTLGPVGQAYCEAIFQDPDFQDWERAALSEPYRIEQAEALYADPA